MCFVAYKDNDEYVLFNVVGDDIDYEIDRSFGGIGTSFGNAVNDNVPSRNYYGNLYFSLATSLDKVNENLYTKYESSNPKAYKVINKTKYGTINGISSLMMLKRYFIKKQVIMFLFNCRARSGFFNKLFRTCCNNCNWWNNYSGWCFKYV